MVLNARLHICRIYESELLFVWERSALRLCLGPFLNFLPRLRPALSAWLQVRQWSRQHSYSAPWLEEAGNAAWPLPTCGQTVVRTGGGGAWWCDVFMNYHDIIKYDWVRTAFTHAHMASSLGRRSPFQLLSVFLFLYTCLHTYSDRVATRSGHCSVLSDLTSLSVSLIWPKSTPLPVHVRARSVHGQTAARDPKIPWPLAAPR